jgi:Type II CAAX prenyl endopeptidase Rce1-like
MIGTFWAEFGILYGAALIGGIAIVPYSMRLVAVAGQPARSVAPSKLLLVQNAVLFAVAVAIGLRASHAVGLRAPFVEAAIDGRVPGDASRILQAALGLGLIGGVFLTVVDVMLLPRLPAPFLSLARQATIWENFTACFYGGVNEELLMRLFGMSGVVWLLSRIWHTPSGMPTDGVFWSAILMMAGLFALGHLPATRAVAGSITPLLLARALVLNIPIGVICGWLFWRTGLEAAIIAHFVADLVYHVGGKLLLPWLAA